MAATTAPSDVTLVEGQQPQSWTTPRIIRIVLSIVVIALPTLVMLFLLSYQLNYRLDQYTPILVDEYVYWHEAYSVAHVGMNTGYYTFEELPAPAAFTHFDPHGPLYPILLGIFARFLGWDYDSILLTNILFTSLGLAAFVLIVKPNIRQLLLTGLLLLTFYPLILYMLNALTEALNFGFAAVIAAIVYIWYAKPEKLTPKLRALSLGFIFFASAFRLPWAAVFVPLLLFEPTVRTPLRFVRALVITGVLCAASFYVYIKTDSVRPGFFSDVFFLQMQQNSDYALHLLSDYINYNIAMAQQGDPFEIFLREQFIFTWGVAFILLIPQVIPAFRRRLSRVLPAREAGFHLLNIGLVLVGQVMFYDMRDWRDFHIFGPHLFLTLLALIAFRRYWIALVLISSSLLIAPNFPARWGDFHDEEFLYNRQNILDFSESINGDIYYDDSTPNAWCNTVGILYWDPAYIGLPAGIGFNKFENAGYIAGPPQSRYLIMPQADYDTLSSRVHFEQIGTTTLGNLYLNQDASCPPWHHQTASLLTRN